MGLGKPARMINGDLAAVPLASKRRMVLWFCLIATALVLAGFFYYFSELNRVRQAKSSELSVIGKIKVEQILRWCQERSADAKRIADSPELKKLMAEWLRDPDRLTHKEELIGRLQLEQDVGVYSQALLVDADQRILLSVTSQPAEMETDSWAAVKTALTERNPVLSRLHQTPSGKIDVDVVSAMRDTADQLLAVVVLTTNAHEFLFPMIQSWPTPSRSGETLLVRRDGDEVIFLNELRHRKDTALKLHFPLSLTTLPATQAVLGRTGIFSGMDYLGMKVIADLRPIPGTDWYLVTKEGESEIQGEVRFRALTVFIAVLMLILCIAGGMAFWYQALQIEERKRVEEEIKKLNMELEERVMQRTAELSIVVKELEAFSYSVSHDLKAPLRAMTGFANILSEDYAPKLDDNGRRVIGVINDNARKMGQLIDDLLKLSHVGRQAMDFADIDVTKLVRSVCHELEEALFRDRAIEVSVKSLPPARADSTLTKQIFTNLISNAMKFTARKEKAVIEIGGYDKDGERVYYVKDNGAGFDMKYTDKLFGVFQRFHTQDEFGGTGIGLAIVRSAVQRHEGRVWAEAEVGQGATFYFTLSKGG